MQIKRQKEFWHLLKIACVSSSVKLPAESSAQLKMILFKPPDALDSSWCDSFKPVSDQNNIFVHGDVQNQRCLLFLSFQQFNINTIIWERNGTLLTTIMTAMNPQPLFALLMGCCPIQPIRSNQLLQWDTSFYVRMKSAVYKTKQTFEDLLFCSCWWRSLSSPPPGGAVDPVSRTQLLLFKPHTYTDWPKSKKLNYFGLILTVNSGLLFTVSERGRGLTNLHDQHDLWPSEHLELTCF